MRIIPLLLIALASGFRVPASDSLAPWFPKAPPLSAPSGAITRVSSATQLREALARATPGSTILLENGEYRLTLPIILRDKTNLVIRSASGNPALVTILGAGWDAERGDLLHIGHCERITIANLSFAEARSYGIKIEAENGPRDIHIYNCRFRNIGVRAIKGSAGQDPNVRAVRGSVRFCSFENTKIPPADWLFGGDYIAAIDMMALENWTFADNVFRKIKGRNGGGRAAIFIWVRSENILVERNLILDCDRGIAFGNPGQSTANLAGEALTYVASGIIQNNCIVGGSDCGIELWHTDGIKVRHNSIWRPERNWARGIRVGAGTRHAEIMNNLVHGEIGQEGGEAALADNLTGRIEGYFVDVASGNLMLTEGASKAIDAAMPLPDVTLDIRSKPRDAFPDLGAFEFARD